MKLPWIPKKIGKVCSVRQWFQLYLVDKKRPMTCPLSLEQLQAIEEEYILQPQRKAAEKREKEKEYSINF